MASVRGMGVAVIISMCGSKPSWVSLLRSARRWATPKRCCSSMMASAKFLNCTFSCMTAWVPTTSAASPLSIMAKASRRSLAFWVPVSQAVVTPSGSSQLSSLRKCCSAKISVGAMSAHCHPASMQIQAANAATTVLPEPTSPCSNRCIGTWRAKSFAISAQTRCCATVNLNGKVATSSVYNGISSGRSGAFGGLKTSGATMASTGARKRARSRRDCNCEICWANNSSALSRCHAGWVWSCKVSSDTSGVGWCKNNSASRSVHRGCGLIWLKSPGGNVSDKSVRAKPASTSLRSTGCDKPATVG